MEPFKKILRTPSAFVLVITAIIALIGVIIQNKTSKEIALIPINTTYTAEAKLTQIASLPTNTIVVVPTVTPNPTSTPDDVIVEVPLGSITSSEGLDYFAIPNSGNLENFYLSVKFSPPYQATDTNVWDFAIRFHNNGNESYILAIDSTRGWGLYQADNKTGEYTKINSDFGAKNIPLNLGESEYNELFLSVSNNTACFSVNGMKSITNKLSGVASSGQIDLIAGYWKGNSQPGKETAFSDLVVHSTPQAGCP